MIGRKALPPHLQGSYRGFLAVLEEVEPAKAGLADVPPSTRLPGRPLRDAVEEYRERLGRARRVMPTWRAPELEDEWAACDRGLREGLGRADRLLASPEDPQGFEALLGAVEHLMDPLDPFEAAAERFRRLRRRARRTD
jgi:hypothetical protein